MFERPCDCVHCIHCQETKRRNASQHVRFTDPFNKTVLTSLLTEGFHLSYVVDLQTEERQSVSFVICATEYTERGERVEIYECVYALVQECLTKMQSSALVEMDMPSAISGAILGKHDLFKRNKHLVQAAGVYKRDHPENQRIALIGDRFPRHNSHEELTFVGVHGIVLAPQVSLVQERW